MSPTDPSRRRFLRAGSGLIAAVAVGGCVQTERSGRGPRTTPAPTEPSPPPTTRRPEPTDPAPAPAPAGATRFRPVRTVRIADTRRRDGWTRIDPQRVRVPVAGQGGVPDHATAVAVRVSGIGATADADDATVSVLPATNGTSGPTTSIESGPGSTTMCFVLLGDGAVDVVHGAEAAAVTVDVLGYFEPVRAASSGGRVVTTEPITIAETRAVARPFAPSETRRITPDDAVPPGALALVIQVTATSDAASGTWTVHPSGARDQPPTLATGPDGARTVTTVVPLSDGGFEVTAAGGGHVRIDVVGHVTGDDAATAVDGLYVPVPPRRLLDTRVAAQPVPAGSCREVAIEPDPCGAVAVNVTAVSVDGGGDGTVSAWGAGCRPTPAAPAALGRPGEAVTHHSVIPTGRRGIALGSTDGDAHLVADLYGWFTGARSTEREPVCGAQPYGIHEIEMERFADEWLDYGTSTDGRPLRAFRHGSGRRVGLITTGLHGDEHTGTSVLADLVIHGAIPGWTLWLVPIANPDARADNVRFVRDVDMNRDFPVDWSEIPNPTPSGCVTTRTGPVPHSLIESRRLAEAMTDGAFRGATISVSHHDNYNWVAPQSGSPSELRDLADRYAKTTGLRLPGDGGSTVPTSPVSTHVNGGFETFAHSLGMSSFLVENKAGYDGSGSCAGAFGLPPTAEAVAPHHQALRALLTDGRLPTE